MIGQPSQDTQALVSAEWNSQAPGPPPPTPGGHTPGDGPPQHGGPTDDHDDNSGSGDSRPASWRESGDGHTIFIQNITTVGAITKNNFTDLKGVCPQADNSDIVCLQDTHTLEHGIPAGTVECRVPGPILVLGQPH